MKKITFLSLPLILLLSACAGPVTMAPQGTQQEILQERAYQQGLSKEQLQAGQANLDAVTVRLVTANADFCGKKVQKVLYRGEALRACAFPLVIDEKDKEINAYTDGNKIVISRKMLNFVHNDNELALVIGHELAHAALNHVGKTTQNVVLGQIGGIAIDQILASQGLNTGGQFASLGSGIAQSRYSVAFEQEADYVGMYFMERAGFNIEGVANFWRRMAANDSRTITQRTSHPTSPERFIAIERTQKEIAAKKKAGERLVPNLAPKK
jgi:Zn-dependent protease with chaperone function